MPTDKLGKYYNVGSIVAIAMANGSPSNQANIVFAQVEEIVPVWVDKHWDFQTRSMTPGRQSFHVKARPLAETHESFGAKGPKARLRTYEHADNILAMPWGTPIDEILPHATL